MLFLPIYVGLTSTPGEAFVQSIVDLLAKAVEALEDFARDRKHRFHAQFGFVVAEHLEESLEEHERRGNVEPKVEILEDASLRVGHRFQLKMQAFFG